MSVRSAKSRLEIDKDCDIGRPKGRLDDFGGRVGGRGGGQQRLLESDRNWQESAVSVSNALLPARGAADFKAPPHAADPNIKVIGRLIGLQNDFEKHPQALK